MKAKSSAAKNDLPIERNAQTVLCLHDLRELLPGFKYCKLANLKLPETYSEAVDFVHNPKNLYQVVDTVRVSFSGPWHASDMFLMPPSYSRDAVSIAHAQLEISKNDLRDLLATISVYSLQFPQLKEYETVLENIYFSLNSVKIPDSNKIQMPSMKAPLI